MLHTRKCGEISEDDFGSEQTLCGWLQDTRNLGGIAFLQLRDITGVIQLTLLKKKLGDKTGNIITATVVGSDIAKKAKEKGIKEVYFDRGGYLYHGRIKALAEAARKEGLKF